MRTFAFGFAAFLICACGGVETSLDDSMVAERSFNATVYCHTSGGIAQLKYVIGRADYGDRVIDFATVPTGDGFFSCSSSTTTIALRPVHLPFGSAVIHLKFMGLWPSSSSCPTSTNDVEMLAPVAFYCTIDSLDELCAPPPTSALACVSL